MVRRSFISDFGVAPEKLVTIWCGPNFDPTTIVSNAVPDVPEPTILFVGRDPVRKGADIMLGAFRHVRERIPTARLVMVGPPQTTPVPEGVEVTGFLDRDTPTGLAAMNAAYASAQVFCLPTRFDAFGTSFVEAMAYGLPCVGPRAWAVPEIIEDGRTGLMVPPEDPQSLAEALITILSDDALRLRMGRAARERMLSTFAWPVLIARMVDSLERVIASRTHSTIPKDPS
jgi:glycosyltransferase involved in cell wall biosynthesis